MTEHHPEGNAGHDAPHAGPPKVTSYTSGNVPGVSYKGGYAHSPDDEDEGAEPVPAASPQPPHGGTRQMAAERPATQAPPREREPRARRTEKRPKKRRSGLARFFRFLLIFVLIIAVALGGLVWWIWSRIDKVEAVPDDHGAATSDGHVFLLVGSDRREDLDDGGDETGTSGGDRADTIMLVHNPSDGRPALISVPRDSTVDIPGHGSGRINAAFSQGGPALLVETIEANTEVAIDDYVQIGFGGFSDIVDALGGVEMCLDEAIQDEKAKLDLPAGCQELGGDDALGYARARYFDPRADLGRVERQRELISAISDKAFSPGTLLNPIEFTRTALAGGDALVIDDGTQPWDMFTFVQAMGSISSGSGDTLTVPLGRVGNTVDWDPEAAGELWSSLQDGTEVPRHLLED
ncbi:LytR family transcriptional regulator [Actinobacteria bacterium YIM 96077]|uniref:LytR family transcriptional regulator n=1 Tax=Phytoactinopolyspora halophila TaxID=1981511 RepID=A0A329R2H7_9ACTN|nr:LCP family protein [Phytoactinopolyspora halophila]AYY11912.1 LytR family transcriptional regulator [Actinobacteria bacterium YIM 96077]RAW18854.1 LytR family transcriptional regulator [Phytoactinopolyspora halophila]